MTEKILSNTVPSIKNLLPKVSVLSSVSLFTIFFGIVTNKTIAVYMGAEGVGRMAIYRSFAAAVTWVLTFGFCIVFLQDLSNDKSKNKQSEIFSAGIILSIIQAILMMVLGTTLLHPFAKWLLGDAFTTDQIWELRVVLVMAWVNIQLQSTIGVLRGLGDIRSQTRTQVITSVGTMALIYPLVKLGSLGLAINVASGSSLALIASIFYIVRKNKTHINELKLDKGIKYLKSNIGSSFAVTWQALITSGGFLCFQTTMQKSTSLEFLGNFAAAYMIVDTMTNVLMASVRGYFLPQFGDLDTDAAKSKLLGRMIELLLLLATSGVVFVCVFSPFIIPLLFSKQFDVASRVAVILSFSLLCSVFSWSFNTLMLHKKSMKLFAVTDSVIMISMVLCAYVAYYLNWPAFNFVYIYTGSAFIGVIIYIFLAVRQYGKVFLPLDSLKLLSVCLFVTAIASIGFYTNSIGLRVIAMVMTGLLFYSRLLKK